MRKNLYTNASTIRAPPFASALWFASLMKALFCAI
jgi:hypothetical protein